MKRRGKTVEDDPKENPEASAILADELAAGWDSTERLTQRIDGYSTLKESTKEFMDWGLSGGIPLFTKGESKLFRKLDSCGSYLLFRNYQKSRVSRLLGACTCKEHLICAFCAARRGVRNSMAYEERVNSLMADNPDQRLIFATFTVKNGPDLFERFTHLRSSMQSFLKRRNHALKRSTPSSFTLANGGVFAYEFKKGSGSGDWHPHIHMLLLTDSRAYLDAQKVKNEWLEITGDSSVVNLAVVEDKAVFLEVFAYALKFSEMEHSDRWKAFKLLKGERLISSFGSFRGVEVPETLTDDLLDSDEEWTDVLFRYRTWRGYDSGQIVGKSSDATIPFVLTNVQLPTDLH